MKGERRRERERGSVEGGVVKETRPTGMPDGRGSSMVTRQVRAWYDNHTHTSAPFITPTGGCIEM